MKRYDIKNLVTFSPEGVMYPISGQRTYDWLSSETNERGGHLPILSKHLKKSNVMVQAGGNFGLLLIPFVDKFDRIYTFEPDPLNFYCLVNNLPQPNVHKIQACLGEDNRMVNIVYPGEMGCVIADVGAFHIGSLNGAIPKFRIDDLCLDQCDLIMLDVEGYEFHILHGAIETIRKFRPVVCVECYNPWLGRFGASIAHIETLLKQFGYEYVESYFQDRIYVFNDTN